MPTHKEPASYQVDTNIKITKKQHDDLWSYLKSKLDDQRTFHDAQVKKFTGIDKKVYGYLVLDEDDKKREQDNKKGYGVKPTDTIMPLVLTQLDEAVTYCMEVLATDTGLYGAIAEKTKQPIATAFAALMNEQADKFSHERAFNMFLFNSMKYNFGPVGVDWLVIKGNKLGNTEAGQPNVQTDQVYSGNKLSAIDPYNLWYDLTVSPTDLASEGEFFAKVEIKSPFKARKMLADEELFNIKDILDNSQYTIEYYNPRPVIRTGDDDTTSGNDWLNILGGVGATTITEKAIEFITFYSWIDVKKYGLDTSEKMKICRITIVNGERISRIQVMNNAHAMLPIGIAMPLEDGFKEATKSFGEMLIPFQTFASAQLNIHTKASRKALYGNLFYNKSVIDLGDEYDPTASKIAVNAPPETDMRKAFYQNFDAPGTDNTMRDIEAVAALMQKVLPTEILKQVAGLDRATQYQAAATVQGGNRRNLKMAKIINDQVMSQIKRIQMYNIYQYQETLEILTPEGELTQVNPTEFRDTRIEFTISDGLRGLDRLSIAMSIKEVLNSILQSQHASQSIDVVEVINYWTSLLGDKTSFSQFRFENEFDKLTPEQKQIAFQLLQQAAAAQEGQPAAQTPA